MISSFAFKVLSLDQIFNALLDIWRLCPKHGDHLDHISNQVNVLVLLLGFHNLHDLRIDNKLALLRHFRLLWHTSTNLLFHSLNGNKRHSDGLISKILIDGEFFIVIFELRILFLFDKKIDFRFGHREESSIELLIRNLGLFFYLTIGEHIITSLVVHIKDGCLEDINDKLIRFLEEL